MKKRKKKKKYDWIILLIVLVIIGYFIFKNKDEEELEPVPVISLVGKVDSSNIRDTVLKEVEDVIKEFMDTYYLSMMKLENKDVTHLFAPSAFEQAYISQASIDLLVDSRKLLSYDMKINKATYKIVYTNYEVVDDEYIVSFTEDNTLNFNFISDITSKSYGIKNEIAIKKVNDEYKIVSYNKVQDFYVMINNSYTGGLEDSTDVKESIENVKNKQLDDIKTSLNDLADYYEEYLNNNNAPSLICDNPYNRETAKDYALKYINERNQDFLNYDSLGGNCQNYASQVLYAGGIPMDFDGHISAQWKHYDSSINESSTPEGRSYSWTGVGNFYTYAKTNIGSGLCAKTNINPYYALTGDIAQVGYNKVWSHTIVIVDPIMVEDKLVDFLVTSNSVNLENYPLSAYVYSKKRIIHIGGYNN